MSDDTNQQRFGTRVIHGGQHPDPLTGAVMPPIYATSTYVQSSPGVHQGYDYSRSRNPTRDALQAAVANLEGGAAGFARGFRLSTELVAGVLVGAAIGWGLDRLIGTSPLGLIVFLLLGFAAGVVNVIRAAGVAPGAGWTLYQPRYQPRPAKVRTAAPTSATSSGNSTSTRWSAPAAVSPPSMR